MTKRETKDLPSKQRDYEVGHCKPPKEHQFKPGQAANPKGPPKRRTQLWVYINQFLEMTDADLAKVDRPTLTQAQKVALKLVENATEGKDCGSERLARYCVDRDEGKASEHLVIDKDNDLSDDECEEIRAVLRKAYDDAG